MALRRNLLSNFVGQGWVAAMGLAFVPVYVRGLGVESYALIGLYAVVQGWLSVLDLGMTPTMNREMARAAAGAHTGDSLADLVRSIEVICFSVAGLVAATIWLASGWLAQHWFAPETLERDVIANAIVVVAFVIASRFCEGIYRGALFGMERQLWYNAVSAILATLRYGGAAIIVTLISPSVVTFFWWQAATSLLSVTILAVATHHWMPRASRQARFSPASLRAIAGFAGGLSMTTIVGLLLTHVDKIMLSRLLTLDDFGQYMLAVAISGVFPMLIMPVTSAFYPSLIKALTTGDEVLVSQRYHIAAQMAAVLLVPALAVCVILPERLLFAWTGDLALADQVGQLLRFLSIGVAFNGLLQVPFLLQLAHGWTSLALKMNCVTAAIMLPLEFIAAHQYGAVGAALVWGAASATVLPVATILMHRRLLPTEQWSWAWHSVIVPIGVSMAMVGATAWLLPATSSRWIALLYVMGAGLAATFAVALSLPALRQMLYGWRPAGLVVNGR